MILWNHHTRLDCLLLGFFPVGEQNLYLFGMNLFGLNLHHWISVFKSWTKLLNWYVEDLWGPVVLCLTTSTASFCPTSHPYILQFILAWIQLFKYIIWAFLPGAFVCSSLCRTFWPFILQPDLIYLWASFNLSTTFLGKPSLNIRFSLHTPSLHQSRPGSVTEELSLNCILLPQIFS